MSYAFHRLKESENEEDKSLAAHIERLEAVVDLAAYGRRYAAEYKITPLAQESFMKLENVDLTALLTKMHALGGDSVTT